MKTGKRFQKITAFILLCIAVIESSVSVFASTTYSNWQTSTTYGISYDYRSVAFERILTTGNTLEAIAEVKTTNNINVPAGYIGAQGRLYNYYGMLVCTSGLHFNSGSTSVMYANSPSITDSGYFYSKSLFQFYFGNGYSTIEGYMSPYASISTRESNSMQIIDELETNKSKTDDEPELIPAIGRNGIKGYVREDELAPIPKTIEEAIELNKKAATEQIIPLYNLDGDVIGEFVIGAFKDEELEILK